MKPLFNPRTLSYACALAALFPALLGQDSCAQEDADGDGWTVSDGDCDDSDSSTHPGATELCDGLDNDCDRTVDEDLTGSSAECPASSCAALLEAGITTDGNYWIDTSAGPAELYCDMTTDGGGWTRVFGDTFETTPDAGWSTSATYACGDWTTMLGGYGNMAGGEMYNDVSLLGIEHSAAWIQLRYLKLDSWDGELAYVEVDDTQVWSANLYYYEGLEMCGWNRGSDGSYDDYHDVSAAVDHDADSLLLLAGSTLDQDAGDESWGIDNVDVWVR